MLIVCEKNMDLGEKNFSIFSEKKVKKGLLRRFFLTKK